MNVRDRIGVLALQGGILEHANHLKAIGVEPILVKKTEDLDTLTGLILPGGESTCLIRLLNTFGFIAPLKEAFSKGMKIWGTCAGAILLAKKLEGEKAHLGLMDITINRNAFGSQLNSFTKKVLIPKIYSKELDITCIRAPKIIEVGKEIEVLLELEDYIAVAENEFCLATIFHPELTSSTAFHRYFAEKCGVDTNKTDSIIAVKDWTKLARITTPAHKIR